MAITHAISTERLVNILQSIALKQQTGCLSIVREPAQEHKREHTQGVEKGNIFFERGDTVFALTGQESGETALFRMLKWKLASYTFTEGMRYTPERHSTGSLSEQVPQALYKFDIRRLSSIKAAENRQTPPIGMSVLPKALPDPLPIDMVDTQLLPAINLAAIPVPTPPEMALPETPAVQITVFSQQNTRETPETRETGKHEQVFPCGRDERGESQASYAISMGVTAVFRALPYATTPIMLNRMERRERVVLLLLNGKRTVRDVAGLVHYSEVDVARTLVRLLKMRYIEYIERSGTE
ncbi:MAG TPA: DUF4388 domain-containing protein [Ktedonobacteraceae bacterium]|nr:DUF4388 domain-containing protein [Ktedonobacteraceae bacterium]